MLKIQQMNQKNEKTYNKNRVAFVQKNAFEKISIHYLAGALKSINIDYNIFIYDLEKNFFKFIRFFN